MIDLHCHVLAGIDDGPQTLEEAVAMSRAAAAVGTRTLVATPHVSARWRNTPERIAAAAEELAERLRAEEIPVEIRCGAEIALTHIIDLDERELARLGLGGGEWLLVEPPFSDSIAGLDEVMLELLHSGHRIVLAHPERSRAFQRDPRALEELVDQGVLTSVTASSLVGRFGGEARRAATRMAAHGLIHNVASDAHAAAGRGPSIARELDRAGLSPLRGWLTETVPEAILASEKAPPPRPPAGVRRAQGDGGWWRRGPLRRASLSR